jgi:hypothetical protein
MLKAVRYKLHFGPYQTPRFKYGQRVEDQTRGTVEIVQLSDARIPWPMAKRTDIVGRKPGLVIYQGLAKALKLEAACAVAHWWGVTLQTITKWRKLLGVGPWSTPGDAILRKVLAREPPVKANLRKAWAKAADPVRRAKISAALAGKTRPRHVIEAIRTSRLGKAHSAKALAKMSAAHKRRGTWPPAAGKAWTKREDRLCQTLPIGEVMRRTGRSLAAVRSRRSDLARAGEQVLNFKG